MRGIVIYDSIFGNTEKVAAAVQASFAADGGVKAVRAAEATPELLADADFVVVGSPTRGFRPTEAVVRLLRSLPPGALEGKSAAAFDTRIAADDIDQAMLRFIVKTGGYAAPVIAKKLERCGASLASEPVGFFVKASEGPLKEGEYERAGEWARMLAGQSTSPL